MSEMFEDFWDNQEWYDIGADLRIKIRNQFTELRKNKDSKIVSLQEEITKLTRQRDIMKKALEFYANTKNWDEVWIDGGDEDSGGDCSCQMMEDVETERDSDGQIYYAHAGKTARQALRDAGEVK